MKNILKNPLIGHLESIECKNLSVRTEKELREAMRKKIAEEKKQKEECSDAPQAAATAAPEDGHDDEVTTSVDGGTNATVGDDTLETERSDSQPSQAGPYLTGSAQKY